MLKKIILIYCILTFLASCGNIDNQNIDRVEPEIITKNILALGDSLTAGYNLDISEAYPSQLEAILKENNFNYNIVNAGVSGDTSQNLLDRIDLYDDLAIDIYLISIGANDGLRRQNIETMRLNISQVITHIKQVNPDATIVLAGMQMPINLGLEYSRDFNKSYKILAETHKIYLYDFLLEDVAKKTDLNLSDGIHPNKEGYKIIANNVYNFLLNKNIINK